MKKDRGFGAASSSASTGCFVCGSHQHMAKDCPDRNSPKGKGKPKGFGGGKGRWLHYMEDDWGYTYAMPMKGKKGKGKGKQAYMVEDYYANAFNFKGKGKSKSKGNHNVNAYMADIHDYYGLQFELQAAEEHQANDGDLDMAAVSAGTTCYGMLDSGATCSAGPEQSIKRLVQAVLTKDSAAQIKVDGQNRPRFRYGSGKWGRAQYHLEIKSSTSARTFQAFALPDPEEITQPWFQDHMLVPVLVGMDFMKGNGMIVDFSDGLAVCAALDEDEPVQLPRNGKSHYMIDLVHFITGGKTNYVGSPTVQVINPLQEEDEPPTRSRSMTSHSLQYMMCPLQLQSHESEHTVISPQRSSKSRHLFLQLWQRHVNPSPRQQARLMGNALAPKSSSTTSPTRSQAHGAQDDRDQGHGLGSHCSHGPSRPQEPSHSMAMHGEPHSHEVALQLGQWKHCSRCALRLEYVPKIGAPANSSALVNPGNVKKALEELQRDLPGHMEPNEELVRVMIEKVIAEERMKTLLAEYQKSWDSAKSKVNKAKEALRPTTSPRSSRTEGYAELRLASPSTSTASWEQVTLRPTPAQEPDYLQYLNEDEKMRLMDLVHQRAQQQAQQVPLPNDTDPENMEPNYEAN